MNKKFFIFLVVLALIPGVMSVETLWESDSPEEPFPEIKTSLTGGSLTKTTLKEGFYKYIFTVPETEDVAKWNIPLKDYRLLYQGNYSARYISPGGRWLVTIDWSDIKSLGTEKLSPKTTDSGLELSIDLSSMARTGAVELDPSIEIDGPLGRAFRGLSIGKNGYEDQHGYFHTVIVPNSDQDIYHVWENAGGWNQQKIVAGGYTSLAVALSGHKNASGEYIAIVQGDGNSHYYFEIGADGDNTTNAYQGNTGTRKHGTLRHIYDYGWGDDRYFGNRYKAIAVYNGSLEDIDTWAWDEPDHSVGVSYLGASSVTVKDYQNAMSIWGWRNGTLIAAVYDGVSWSQCGHVTDNGETTDNYDRGWADVTHFESGGNTHFLVVFANETQYLKYRVWNTTSDSWGDVEIVDHVSGPLDGSYSPKVETWNGTPQIVCAEESDNHLYFWNVSHTSYLNDDPIPWNRYLLCGDDTADGSAKEDSPKLDWHIENGSRIGHATWTNSSGVYYLDTQIGGGTPTPAPDWNITWLGTGTPCHCPEAIMLTWEILGNDSGYYRIYRNGSVRWDYDTWDSPCNISLVDICFPGYTNYTLWMNDSVGNVQTYTANFTDRRFFDDFDDCETDWEDMFEDGILDLSTMDHSHSSPPCVDISEAGGVVSINGSGKLGSAPGNDEFVAAYKHNGLDTQHWIASTNVTAIDWSRDWSKIGLMARNNIINNGSSTGYVLVGLLHDQNYPYWGCDSSGNGLIARVEDERIISAQTLPIGLRIIRCGDTYSGWYNPWDGTGWAKIYSGIPASPNTLQDVALFSSNNYWYDNCTGANFSYIRVCNYTMDGNWSTFDNTPVASSFDVCNGSLCMTGDGAYQRNEYISTYLDDIGPSFNWTATTNVTSFNTSSGWGKAGIMTRTDMTDNSTPGIALSWSPRSVGTIQFFWDSDCDGHFDDFTFSADQYPLPVGLRLRRMNGTCTYRAYVNNWTGAGWQYLWERSPCSCADNLYQDIGLFQMSSGYSDIEIAESCFDHFELNYSVFTGSWVYGANEIPTVEAWNSTDCCAHFRVTDEDDENGTYYVWNSTSDLLATGTWTNYTNFTYCVGSAGIWNVTLWADDSCNWSGNNSNTSWVTCASSFECVNDTYIGDVFNVSFNFLSSVTGTPVRVGLYHNGSLIQSSYNYTTNATWYPMIYAWQPNGTYTAVLQNLTGGSWSNLSSGSNCSILVRPWPTHLLLKAEQWIPFPAANKVFWWKNDLDPRCEWYIETYRNDSTVSWAYLMNPGWDWDDYRQWPDLNWISTAMWMNESQPVGIGYYTRLIGYYPNRSTNLGNYTWDYQWQEVIRPYPSFSVSTQRWADSGDNLEVVADFSNLSFWPHSFRFHPTKFDWAVSSAGQVLAHSINPLAFFIARGLDWHVGGQYGGKIVVRGPENDTVAEYSNLVIGRGLPGRTSFDWGPSKHRVDGTYTFDGYVLGATNSSWVYIGSDTIEIGQSTWNLVDSLAESLDALLGFGEGTLWLLVLFTFMGLVLVISSVVGHFFSGAVVALVSLAALSFLGVFPMWAAIIIGVIGAVLLWITGGRVSYG